MAQIRCVAVSVKRTEKTANPTENETGTVAYKKKMSSAHGDVKIVNKTGIAKLNRKFKKTGTLETEDFTSVGYKKVDMTNHKPVVKKKW